MHKYKYNHLIHTCPHIFSCSRFDLIYLNLNILGILSLEITPPYISPNLGIAQ